jgi:hypothetical protein
VYRSPFQDIGGAGRPKSFAVKPGSRYLRALGTGALGAMAFSPNGLLFAAADLENLYVWNTVTGDEVLRRPAPRRVRSVYTSAFTNALAFSPDSRILATGLPDSTVLFWDMTNFPTAKPAAVKDALAELTSEDAKKAWSAIWHLAGSPEDAVPLLRTALKPIAPIPADRLRGLIADLDAVEFAKRGAASQTLASFGEQAEPALREALTAQPSAEKRKRIESLLAAPYLPPTKTMLRSLRGIEALEIMATPAAREFLGALAAGDPAARETKAAKSALERVRSRK